MEEKWHKVFKNKIPKDIYRVSLEGGEENGLIIKLISDNLKVILDFGTVQSVRMIEEGLQLNPSDDKELKKQIEILKEEEFDNIIYEVTDGEFGNFIKNISAGMYEIHGFKHYVIITLNYVIEVVGWEPEISVVYLK